MAIICSYTFLVVAASSLPSSTVKRNPFSWLRQKLQLEYEGYNKNDGNTGASNKTITPIDDQTMPLQCSNVHDASTNTEERNLTNASSRSDESIGLDSKHLGVSSDQNSSSNVAFETIETSSNKNETTSLKKLFSFRKRNLSKQEYFQLNDEARMQGNNHTTISMNTSTSQPIPANRTDDVTNVSNATKVMSTSSDAATVENVTVSSPPNIIVLQRSLPLHPNAPVGYYRGGLMIPSSQPSFIQPSAFPPSTPSNQQVESSILAIVSALLPILSKLLLLMLLSGSSLIFGPHDLHPIYSPSPNQHFILERVNDRYSRDDIAFKRAVQYPPANKSKRLWKLVMNQRRRSLKKLMDAFESDNSRELQRDASKANPSKQAKYSPRSTLTYDRTVIIVDVHTDDIKATVEYLRDVVSFILHLYHNTMDSRLDMGRELEIVFCVESPGGAVQEYGLAADQLTRLRTIADERGDMVVTVCVDKIAASGGYMIACQASPGRLLAAPLAILGSIGVLRETLNIHDILMKYGIRPLLIKAGEAKVPLTSTAAVTKEGIAFVQKNVDITHALFKKMVLEKRGDAIDPKHIAEVTSGDIFLGSNALGLGLIDRLVTSDEYISERIRSGDRVLKLQKYDKSRAGMRFSPLDLLIRQKRDWGLGISEWIESSVNRIAPFLKLAVSVGMIINVARCIFRIFSYKQVFLPQVVYA